MLTSLGRLLVWTTLIFAIVRCPTSLDSLTDQSPAVCRPYAAVLSRLWPHISPYHDTYTKPYIDAARPYTDKLYEQVYTPTIDFSKQNYAIYGEPRVNQARAFSQAQWKNILKPQIDVAQAQVFKGYEASLGPHVNRVSAATAPYYTTGRDTIVQAYSSRVVPAYAASRPYIDNVYALVHKALIDVGLPYAQLVWDSSMKFIDRIVWPKLRILYGENVEPQLMRIGERLGRYRDSKKLKAAIQELDNSEESTSLSSSILSISSSVGSAIHSPSASSLDDAVISSATTVTVSSTPEQEAAEVREKIANDLKVWQEKFAKAAGKGTEELDERVKEITNHQITKQVHGTGEALVVQLEETVTSEIAKLKRHINKVVGSLPHAATEEDIADANKKVSQLVRNSGQAVKAKAQALRTWKQKFDNETQYLITAASDSTLEVIDNIRDLGLQEVGMRWAWMEGVTYKDWSNYYAVKKTFDKWRNEVETVTKDHPSLLHALSSAEEIEARGMAIAEDAAKELARLKEVGMWKVESGDATDDFSTKIMPAKAALAGQKLMDKISSASESVLGNSQGTVESMASEATQRAADASDYVSAAILGSSTLIGDSIISVASTKISEIVYGTPQPKVESVVSAASTKISEGIYGTQQPRVESVVSAASHKVDQAVKKAGEAIKGTPAPAYESVASEVSRSVMSASSVIPEAFPSSSTPLSGTASRVLSSASDIASSAANHASQKVFGGAMAQEVEDRIPIFDDLINEDDEASYSEKMQSIINQAGDKYSDVTQAVSDALFKPSSTQGTGESITSLASEQYNSALAAASSVLYGTSQGTGEILSSVASSRYAQAVAA